MWQDVKNVHHFFSSVLANVWYGFPSKKLTVIGVTGTDGKTTTVNLIYHILKNVGYEVSMISSVGAVINGKKYDIGFHVTTPSAWQIQKFLTKAKGCLILEVTSHALDQYRVWGIDFAVGVLTNITNEHLDYHKSYDNYVRTKVRLLKKAKIAVVNRDDDSYGVISNKFITYGIKNKADVTPKVFPFKTKLIGDFNKYNILAAVTACRQLGVSDDKIRYAIETFTLPVGRAEVMHEDNFTVMIDFAHTPNALEQILRSLRPEIKGRIIHVFGSAGERDRQKRPKMGEVSAKYADVIVLTAEDPRSESMEKIMEDIELGIQNKTVIKITDRQEAITAAIKMAKKGDFVLLTGKSHEQSMNYGKGEEPWNEFDAVKQALKEL
ncbi:MAG: UDP-N-acetylmuramoyl-L-alanyl-D-glutamate--2,6-diaminopimelate ligase [Candidatus Levybacteria bacterium]|nr:UDP-N-acetylmuramoyl-L-alanyl-D-glutamate--2,6-diaminopimelate ligase [Candidatus Levybacteria bacterium]